MQNDTADDANVINKLNATKIVKILMLFKHLEEIFMEPKIGDKAHETADEKADEEQPETTDMLDLESEESAEQSTMD